MTDYISRADAIKAIRKCKFESVMPSDWYRGMEDAQEIVEDIPSAETHEIRTETHSVCLISKADAIEEISKGVWNVHELIGRINGLPSADAVQGWIPCSDKLPSNNDCVLVTVDDSIEFGKYQDGEWSIWVCEHWDKWDAKGTIAWMPLPKPYKGGEDE